MPRYNVEYNGKWACFSSIVDSFLTSFMNKEDYEQWRINEYGIKYYEPVEQCNRMTMDEALFSMKLNTTREEVVELLQEMGFSDNEINTLLKEDSYDSR